MWDEAPTEIWSEVHLNEQLVYFVYSSKGHFSDFELILTRNVDLNTACEKILFTERQRSGSSGMSVTRMREHRVVIDVPVRSEEVQNFLKTNTNTKWLVVSKLSQRMQSTETANQSQTQIGRLSNAFI